MRTTTSPHRSLARDLFDLNFRTFVTPRVVPVLYLLLMFTVGIGLVAGAWVTYRVEPNALVLALVLMLMAAVIVLMVARLMLERAVIHFRIAEQLRESHELAQQEVLRRAVVES